MDAAENGIRLRGYHAVSFRDLAGELGIKSSSVHYYFRQKEDLGLALVRRYGERFFAALDAKAANARTPEARLRAFCGVYRDALVGSDRICLCGMLGAESCGLPKPLSDAVADFFAANIDWLAAALPKEVPARRRRKRAAHIVATLQGAMVLASSMKDHTIFDDAVTALT
jgi:TetR/AcrR family transcriptional repressor of nem operon